MFELVGFLIIIILAGGIFYRLHAKINKDESEKEKELKEIKREVFALRLDQRHLKDSLWKTKKNLKRLYREIDPTGNNISYDK